MGILLIATVGKNEDPVITGIREFPVSKLVLICKKGDEDTCDDIREKVFFLKIDVEKRVVVGEDLIREFLEILSEIESKNASKFDDVYIDVGGGDREMHCAAISAAFIKGIKAFDVMEDMVRSLPVLKFSYDEVISDAKLNILKTLDSLGGTIDSLNTLSEESGVEKSLLSYHIRGGRDSKGLEELGLVKVDRRKSGTLKIKLTTMGELMLIGRKQ